MRAKLPAGACNAHCHVFGPRERFPFAADAPFIPAADAPKEELFALNDRLGLQRCVVVQSTCHGLDNRVTEDAVAVTRSDGVAAMAAACVEAFGTIDVLVNNVGGSAPGGPVEMSEDVWDTQVDTNLKSVFLACKHVLPTMLANKSGSIVRLRQRRNLPGHDVVAI